MEQTSIQHIQHHPASFNQSSQKSVCLKYLGSCSYYSKTRTCRSTADIFCPLLTTALLRAKKEKQKCIKVVFYFGKLNDLDPRSLSQFQLNFALLKIRLSKGLGLLGTFTTNLGLAWPGWSNLLCLSENFAKKKKFRITRQQLALQLHNEPVHDIGWLVFNSDFLLSHDFFPPCRYVQLLMADLQSKDINSCSTSKSFFILFANTSNLFGNF